MPSPEGSTYTNPASPDPVPQRRSEGFAGANTGLDVLAAPAAARPGKPARMFVAA